MLSNSCSSDPCAVVEISDRTLLSCGLFIGLTEGLGNHAQFEWSAECWMECELGGCSWWVYAVQSCRQRLSGEQVVRVVAL